jgi:hypothetical protein
MSQLKHVLVTCSRGTESSVEVERYGVVTRPRRRTDHGCDGCEPRDARLIFGVGERSADRSQEAGSGSHRSREMQEMKQVPQFADASDSAPNGPPTGSQRVQ